MKKKLVIALTVLFAFLLMLGNTAAFAAAGNAAPPVSTPAPKATNKYGTRESRLAFLQEIKPLLEEIAFNRLQLKSFDNALITARQSAQAHIKALRANVKNVTAARLAKLSDLLLQIKQVHVHFTAGDGGIGQQLKNLRSGRLGKDYDAIKLAYANISSIQQQRIDNLQKLIDLYNQIAAV
jgi:hypothetical protein